MQHHAGNVQIEKRRDYYDHKHAHNDDLFRQTDFVKQSSNYESHGDQTTAVKGVSHRGEIYWIARVMLGVDEVETSVMGETLGYGVRRIAANYKTL